MNTLGLQRIYTDIHCYEDENKEKFGTLRQKLVDFFQDAADQLTIQIQVKGYGKVNTSKFQPAPSRKILEFLPQCTVHAWPCPSCSSMRWLSCHANVLGLLPWVFSICPFRSKAFPSLISCSANQIPCFFVSPGYIFFFYFFYSTPHSLSPTILVSSDCV